MQNNEMVRKGAGGACVCVCGGGGGAAGGSLEVAACNSVGGVLQLQAVPGVWLVAPKAPHCLRVRQAWQRQIQLQPLHLRPPEAPHVRRTPPSAQRRAFSQRLVARQAAPKLQSRALCAAKATRHDLQLAFEL